MDKMIRAGGWGGARYSKAGNLNSAWWKKVQAVVKECKAIKYFSNSGNIDPEWKIFDTREAAQDAAQAAVREAAWEAAWAAAWEAVRAAVGAAAWDAALLARCEIVGFLDDNQFKIHAQKRMDVWRAGYGLLCDVGRVLYVYKKS